MGKMLLSLSLTLVSNFDFDSECLVVNINIQNQDWQISFSKSKLNIQDYALGCQYQDSNSRFKSCISRLVLNFNICKFAWQYSIPKSKSLQTSNSTSISRILSISTSKSTNINNFAHLCLNNALHLCLKRGKMGCSVSSFNYSALRVTDASRVRCMTAFRLKSRAVPLEIVFKSSWSQVIAIASLKRLH